MIDEGKPTITQKSTLLTKEIRLYNSIAKYDDLKKLTAVEDSQPKSVIEQEETTPTPTPQAQEPPGERPMELEEPEASDANRSSIEPETMPLDVRGIRFIQIAFKKPNAKNFMKGVALSLPKSVRHSSLPSGLWQTKN